MTKTTAPARDVGGRTGAPATTMSDEADLAATLPEKLRVHALAKLLAVSSKDVMAALGELGVAVRSAQSSIDRETAVRAMQMLLPEPEPTEIDELAQQGALDTPVPPTLHPVRAPIFNAAAPVFLPPSPQPTATKQSDLDGDAEEGSGPDETGVDEADADGSTRRRRRRGRRGRGRGKAAGGDIDDSSSEQHPSSEQDDSD